MKARIPARAGVRLGARGEHALADFRAASAAAFRVQLVDDLAACCATANSRSTRSRAPASAAVGTSGPRDARVL